MGVHDVRLVLGLGVILWCGVVINAAQVRSKPNSGKSWPSLFNLFSHIHPNISLHGAVNRYKRPLLTVNLIV